MKDLKQNKVMTMSNEYQKNSDERHRENNPEILSPDLSPKKNMEE